MARLSVELAVLEPGLDVSWRLDGVALEAGDCLARLPLTIAGVPTVALKGADLTARDDSGECVLASEVVDDEDGPVRTWLVRRASSGAIVVSHRAMPTDAPARAASPPLELRREHGGWSGALKRLVALPPVPGDLSFELRWALPMDTPTWQAVTSLGEAHEPEEPLRGTGLEMLRDTYLMCGPLAERHHRDGDVSTWWLTQPGFDVEDFSERLGTTYRLLTETFDAPAHPYRVFLRTHGHRGASASAHPASFVMAMNPLEPLDDAAIFETVAHELVHEWLRLDGPPEEVTWFVEGSADYYSLLVPLRADMIEADAFAAAANLAARECYANPRRELDVRSAQAVFFSDFRATRLPYGRGMFYLADLDQRLRSATAGERVLDDVVRAVVAERQRGERVDVDAWCGRVDMTLGGSERQELEEIAFAGARLPVLDCFGDGFRGRLVEVPVLDLGMDPMTFVTKQVTGVVAGGVADRAGLRNGDQVDLPHYRDALLLDIGDVLEIVVTRDGTTDRVEVGLDGESVLVPQWTPA